MRLSSRLFRFPGTPAPVVPSVPQRLAERGRVAVADLVEAVHGSAPPRPVASHTGRTVAMTAAVTVTAVVATAAYVWWKRRDHSETGIPDSPAHADAREAPTATSPVAAAPADPFEPQPYAPVVAPPVEAVQTSDEIAVSALALNDEPPATAAEPGPRAGVPASRVAAAEREHSRDMRAEPEDCESGTAWDGRLSAPLASLPLVSPRFSVPAASHVALPGGGSALP